MKKLFFLFAIAALVGFASCKKTTWCQCSAVVNNESVMLGEETEPYYMEAGSCSDKEKEFKGWGQVICREVDNPNKDQEPSFWDKLFGGGNQGGNNGGH